MEHLVYQEEILVILNLPYDVFLEVALYANDINAKDEFKELFKDTYIGQHPTKERNSYYILRFDFSGMNTDNVEVLKTDFYERVKDSCTKFLDEYHMDLTIDDTMTAASYFSKFKAKSSNLCDH